MKETVVDIARKAAKSAIENLKDFDKTRIQLIINATESQDLARPLNAFIADELELEGQIRSYKIKHACYSGTLAIKQAVEWLNGASRNDDDVALVVMSDICLYKPGDTAEATQGGCAIAFIIGKPTICSIDYESIFYSFPVLDFYRPVNMSFPVVNAKQSIESYNRCLIKLFEILFDKHGRDCFYLFDYFAFHTPFPKMVLKSFYNLLKFYKLNLSEEEIYNRVEQNMQWNRFIGNSYTASLWIAVLKTLAISKENDRILCFSYGSGCCSELLFCNKRDVQDNYWSRQIEDQIKNQKPIGISDYTNWRK